MEFLPEGQKNNTSVSWEDQQKINEFSTLITKKDRISSTLTHYKTEKEYLDDLSLEIELVDEDEMVNYKIGDTFVLMKQADAVERLEKRTAFLESQTEKIETQVESIDDKLSILKKQLYAKFGDAINLER